MNANSDEQFVREAQAGGPEAFRKLFHRHKDAVYSYCLRILGNPFDAEDAAQEAFVQSYEGLSTLDHPASFRYWLYTIVRNEVFGRLRHRKQYHQVTLDDADDEVWEVDTPFEQTVRGERAAFLRHLLDRLRPEYREALILREQEGFTYAEIAAVTGASEAAVKACLFKARRALMRVAETERDTS